MQSIDFGLIPLEFASAEAEGRAWKLVEIGERVTAATLLVLLAPLLLTAIVMVALLSRRSPLIAHHRVGQGGLSIWVLKLRTMWGNEESSRFRLVERLNRPPLEIPVPKLARDPRVTSTFAALCRRYSLDELPQLWHVVRGEMTFVGPRPLTTLELETYYGSDARLILAKRPGLSGLWQIKGRSRLSYAQRRRLDLFLVRKWSISLYLWILLATVPRVLAGKDAW